MNAIQQEIGRISKSSLGLGHMIDLVPLSRGSHSLEFSGCLLT